MRAKQRSFKWVALTVGIAFSALGCSGGGGGGGGDGGGGSANVSLTTTGGAGASGDGGHGGAVLLVGRAGGDIAVQRSGAVDASFRVPDLRPSLGGNPLIIASSLSITVTVTQDDMNSDQGITLQGSVDPARPATGLLVERGATFTIRNSVTPTEPDEDPIPVAIRFEDGVIIEGTLATGTEGFFLNLDDGGLLIEESGRVLCEGFRESTMSLLFGTGGGGLGFVCVAHGAIVNRGVIDASGTDGPEGGAGGAVALVSSMEVLSTGKLDLAGGTGSTGAGGAGGFAEIGILESEAGVGFVGLGGVMDLRGGEGATRGGDGGVVAAINSAIGSLASNGTIDISGGIGHGVTVVAVEVPDSEPVNVTRSGGNAGFMICFGFSAGVRATGSLLARGGDSLAAAAAAPAGHGGTIMCLGGAITEVQGSSSGSLLFSADIDTRGGAGPRGGNGGPVLILSASSGSETGVEVDTPSILLAGYRGIDASGGASVGGSGGSGASNLALNFLGFPFGIDEITGQLGTGILAIGSSFEGLGGDVSFDVDIAAHGGESTEDGAGNGGFAGDGAITILASIPGLNLFGGSNNNTVEGTEAISMSAVREGFVGSGVTGGHVSRKGRLDLSGGAGVAGGRGGLCFLAASGDVSVTGAANLSGGQGREGLTAGGTGGRGGFLGYAAQDAIVAEGGADLRGGAAPAGTGGAGGLVYMAAASIRTSGDLLCAGGAGETGGDGGTFEEESPQDVVLGGGLDDLIDGGIALYSSEVPTDVRGKLSVAGGEGASADGASGRIVIDGHDLSTSGEAVLP